MKKIISISEYKGAILTLEELQAELKELVCSTDRHRYLQQAQDILRRVRLETLPVGAQEAWRNLPIGFHTHQIFKSKDVQGHTGLKLQLKAYMFSLREATDSQGAIVIVPHSHTGIPEDINGRFYQAITSALAVSGDVRVQEENFVLEDGKAIYQRSQDRHVGDIKYDHDSTNIHNLVGEGTGKAVVLALYVTAGNPDHYHKELVTTVERADQFAQRAKKGYTPYRPTFEFTDAFELAKGLETSISLDTKTALDAISFTGLQQKVTSRHFELNLETLAELDTHLDRIGLAREKESKSLQVSLRPIVKAILRGEVSDVLVSWKPETNSCKDSTRFRINRETLTAGIPLYNELLLNVRLYVPSSKTEPRVLRVYISRATFETVAQAMSSTQQYDLSAVGVTKFAVNPHNVLHALKEHAETTLAGHKVVFHIQPESYSDEPVSNNLGSRNFSITAKGSDYFKILEHEVEEARAILDVEINKDPKFFWTQEQRLEEEAAKATKPTGRKTGVAASGGRTALGEYDSNKRDDSERLTAAKKSGHEKASAGGAKRTTKASGPVLEKPSEPALPTLTIPQTPEEFRLSLGGVIQSIKDTFASHPTKKQVTTYIQAIYAQLKTAQKNGVSEDSIQNVLDGLQSQVILREDAKDILFSTLPLWRKLDKQLAETLGIENVATWIKVIGKEKERTQKDSDIEFTVRLTVVGSNLSTLSDVSELSLSHIDLLDIRNATNVPVALINNALRDNVKKLGIGGQDLSSITVPEDLSRIVALSVEGSTNVPSLLLIRAIDQAVKHLVIKGCDLRHFRGTAKPEASKTMTIYLEGATLNTRGGESGIAEGPTDLANIIYRNYGVIYYQDGMDC